MTGWLPDGEGLEKGLLFPGPVLTLGAVIATFQKALPRVPAP
jgi:hypothetical protein